jgi:hypothetical protein
MRFRSLLLAAVALLPSIALGQATIQLSGSKLLDNNGNLLPAGKIVLTVTDASGTPVTYTPQGGSPTTATYTDTVVNGAVQYVGGSPRHLPGSSSTTNSRARTARSPISMCRSGISRRPRAATRSTP